MGRSGRGNNPKKGSPSEIICYCNSVPRSDIEDAIRGGAKTLNKIFDLTMAGVGACGGSCRRKLQPMLEHYQKTGEFPSDLPDTRKARKDLLSKKRKG